MAVIKPFKAWHYNAEKVKSDFGGWKNVVVPPYDVISPTDLKNLKAKTPLNFSHIILADGENKHQKAARAFRQWQKENAMVQDPLEGLYFYRQTFKLDYDAKFLQPKLKDHKEGEEISRVGFFARVGLEKYSDHVVLPHEKTFSGPKKDRYELMTEMQGQAEPVFLGYPSERFSGSEFSKVILGQTPFVDFKDDDGVRHELWPVTSKGVLEEMEKVFSGLQLFILDGHHRYETALKFYEDHKSADARLSHRYVLAQVCSLDQFGALILPTHRVVNGLQEGFEGKLLEALPKAWKVDVFENVGDLEKHMLNSKTCVFGMLLSSEPGRFYALSLKSEIPGKLDLEVLHENLIPEMLFPLAETKNEKKEEVLGGDMHDDSHGSCEISYLKSSRECLNLVHTKGYQIGFIVRPNTMQDVVDTARASKVMPHKSTFFYPKIPSGLLVNLFD